MGGRKPPVEADPEEVYRLWCDGLDTDSIAHLLCRPEYAVYSALQTAREARRRPVDKDHSASTTEHKPPLEDI